MAQQALGMRNGICYLSEVSANDLVAP